MGQVQGSVLVMYVYQLRTDDNGNESVAVEKITYRKETEEEKAAA
jgi:vacuolar protein sorting-associated protein 29